MPNRLPWALAAGVLLLGSGGGAHGQPTAADIARIEAELARHLRLIEAQQREIATLRAERDEALAEMRGGGRGAAFALQPTAPGSSPARPATRVIAAAPVGEAPPERADVAAIPPDYGVLTPKGRMIFDPSLEYLQNSNPRLVFRGVEITPGIQLGVIEASDAQRSTGLAMLATRYGLTDRLEVEARIPYIVRRDRITTLSQREESVTDERKLDGQGFGDLELSGRFQINSGQRGRPVFVATSRLRAPTGDGPYDVRYDEAGIARELATGSGFWGLEGGVTVLYPTDPAVLFGGLTYLHNFARDVDKTIGSVPVGRVDPGDSIGAVAGFGLSLNPRFAVSFGYSHTYIFPTDSELGDSRQHSQPLQVGSLQIGGAYRLSERVTVNTTVEVGVTADAPDVRVIVRTPFRF